MIKKVLLFSLMIFLHWSNAQIKWMSFEEAIKEQKKVPKKIFISFYADYCANCKQMDATTYSTPEIYNYINENYYFVKFNVETKKKINYLGRIFDYDKTSKMNSFVKFMNVSITPSMVFLDEKANPITILQGRLTARELDPYLQFFASDKYLKVKSKKDWENYLRKFKSKIKE